ncbi:Uncharacterized conserved protein YybS, DUF2232 family [Marininema mesophilum]|uniref:Uncharacterized conserved protein YybS, DUF2232 family n=1 Tax=Marininema mesophilum TaxID=1048340 RepID=A0A1H3AHJ6_9BACL|nr:DUF2232 domain-containing protein [Marininema mesophilum]SDX28654.1 Uncharacterized conserved protein YybS, DUF2232 family [Marininema mesophilum]
MSRFADARYGLITFGIFILLIVSLLTPFSLLTIWFLPLPFFLHGARWGGRSLIFPVTVSGLFILFLFPHALVLSLYGFSVVTGSVMGLLYRRENVSGTDVVLGGVIAAWVSMLLIVIVTASFTDLFSELAANWDKQWQLMEQKVKSLGTVEKLPNPQNMGKVLPGMLLLTLLPFPILNFVLGRRFLKRSGLPRKEMIPFYTWRLPRSFFYFYFVSLAGLLVTSSEASGSFDLLFSNAVALLYVLFMIQGWSFISYILHTRGKSKKWMILVVVISLMIPPATVVLHLLGVLDTGTQIRQRIKGRG